MSIVTNPPPPSPNVQQNGSVNNTPAPPPTPTPAPVVQMLQTPFGPLPVQAPVTRPVSIPTAQPSAIDLRETRTALLFAADLGPAAMAACLVSEVGDSPQAKKLALAILTDRKMSFVSLLSHADLSTKDLVQKFFPVMTSAEQTQAIRWLGLNQQGSSKYQDALADLMFNASVRGDNARFDTCVEAAITGGATLDDVRAWTHGAVEPNIAHYEKEHSAASYRASLDAALQKGDFAAATRIYGEAWPRIGEADRDRMAQAIGKSIQWRGDAADILDGIRPGEARGAAVAGYYFATFDGMKDLSPEASLRALDKLTEYADPSAHDLDRAWVVGPFARMVDSASPETKAFLTAGGVLPADTQRFIDDTVAVINARS